MGDLGNNFDFCGVVDDDDELVSAQSAGHAAARHDRADTSSHDLKQLIASGVAERVIDAFEAIDIQKENGDSTPVPIVDDRTFEVIDNSRTVQEFGE